jgi:hypothetical protein
MSVTDFLSPAADYPFARVMNSHLYGRPLVALDLPTDEAAVVCGMPSELPQRPKQITHKRSTLVAPPEKKRSIN